MSGGSSRYKKILKNLIKATEIKTDSNHALACKDAAAAENREAVRMFLTCSVDAGMDKPTDQYVRATLLNYWHPGSG